MKKLFTTAILLILVLTGLQAQNVWRHRACFPVPGAVGQVSFTLGNKAYVVATYDENANTGLGFTGTFWEYDYLTDTWTQKNRLPKTIANAVSFVINGIAYVTTGLDSVENYLNETWKYNAATDQWTSVASFPGTPRYTAMGFSLNGKGYLGCGFSGGAGDLNDFYQYDPSADVWTQKADFPGYPRQSGFGATIGGRGYMGLGYSGGVFNSDVYAYNDATNTWTAVASMNAGRTNAFSFNINDTLYIAGGYYNGFYLNDCWRYDVPGNSWLPEKGFGCISPEIGNYYSASFVEGGHGYIISAHTQQWFTEETLEFGPLDVAFTNQVDVLGPDTAICGNFSKTFAVDDLCALWSTGEVGSSITINTPGTYWVRLNDSCGVSADSIHITQNSLLIVSVSAIGDTLVCYGSNLQFQWYYNDSAIAGATSYYYLAHNRGNYQVMITDTNGCSATSNAVYEPTGLNNVTAIGQISVYPNPTNTNGITLEINPVLTGSKLEILDERGALVNSFIIQNPKSVIELNGDAGVYLLRVTTATGSYIQKIIKL